MELRDRTGLEVGAETSQGSHATIPAPVSVEGLRAPPTPAENALVQGLGWFSVGLGLSELLCSRGVSRASGIDHRPALLRLFGARELASGLLILLGRRPTAGLWSRVAGDALDLGLLAESLLSGRRRPRALAATAAVAGVTALDVYAAARLTRRQPGPRLFRAIKSVAINRAPDECYAFWRNLSNLACFMEGLERVTALDERRSRWIARGPAGRRVEWEGEITRDDPGSLIAWRSLPGGDIETEGVVQFQPRPGERGTMVRVALEWRPPAGVAGEAVARLFVVSPAQQLKEDLRRMKQLLETGEVPTTEGQPAGRRGAGHRALARWLTGGVA